jgi:hypothetical protein
MLTYAYLAGEGTGVAASSRPAATALTRAVLEREGTVLAREIRAVGRHLRHDHSEAVCLYISLVAAPADLPETFVARVCPHLRSQHLHLCTSKASKLSTCPPRVLDEPVRHAALLAPPAFMSVCIRQHTSAYVGIYVSIRQ